MIAPEGNRVLTTWDERDLPFTITRGAGTPEESTVQLDYDMNGNRHAHALAQVGGLVVHGPGLAPAAFEFAEFLVAHAPPLCLAASAG